MHLHSKAIRTVTQCARLNTLFSIVLYYQYRRIPYSEIGTRILLEVWPLRISRILSHCKIDSTVASLVMLIAHFPIHFYGCFIFQIRYSLTVCNCFLTHDSAGDVAESSNYLMSFFCIPIAFTVSFAVKDSYLDAAAHTNESLWLISSLATFICSTRS